MKLKDIVQKANAASGSVDNKLVQESISSYLLEFAQTFESNLTSQSADQHCQSLDDLISCQPFCAVTSNRIILERLYKRLFVACSGTAVRNSLNTVSNVLNDKISSIFCKEVALIIINTVFKIRPNECISAASSSMQILVRFTKVSESEHRKLALKGITSIVEGTGTFNVDELIRLISKLSYDKEVKVRFCCPSVLVAMIRKSSSIDYELFSSVLIKRLDESDTKVLKVVCNSLALLLLAKIKEFNLQKELQKIDKARGTANIEPDNKNKLSRLSFGKFIQKRILEDFSVLSVVDYLLQNLVKATVLGVKSAYLLVLGEIISAIGTEITQDEYYSLIINLFSILHEILPENTRFEDATVVCSKFSSVIRMIVSGPMTEAKLIDFAASLCKYLTGMESKTEYELQIILSELNSILHQLQETCAVIADDVQGAASLQLRHGSFGVRDAAAKLLVTLSCQVPFVAKDVMHSALANTRVQDKQLFNLLEEENDSSNNTNANSTDTNSLKKKANKDAEKMQRMYFFHGNTLSIAMLMKAHLSIPFGVAKANVIEIINLGLELLDRNMFDASGVGDSATCCSIVRAGSIIISSCISFGYLTVKLSIATILEACQRILRPANQIKSNNNSEDKEDKVIHEIMHVEACLVIFSSILTYCPEALVLEPDVLPIIVDGLENTFRAVKGKFQPICKENFRFCTVHVALLDCFCQLPRGSNAGSAQQVYVEALRVLRDAISSGSTCTQAIEEKSLAGTLQSSLLISWWRVAKIYEYSGPFTPSEILLDIESHSKLLQKKECEAFLVSFRRFNNNKYTSQISFLESAELNSNTVNSTISLIASTFIDQNAEYQVKTIQLCAQAIAQFVKTNAKASMFTTEEDKKKRNKKSASTSLNVITILHAIATKIPLSTDVNVLLWLANAVEILFDAISRGSIYVNYLASITLTRLGELKNSQIFDDIGGRIRSIIMQSLIKKGDTMLSIAPYSLILSLFWGSSSCNSDTKSMLLTVSFISNLLLEYLLPHLLHLLSSSTVLS